MQAVDELVPASGGAARPVPLAKKLSKKFFHSPLLMLGGAFGLAILMWAFNFQPVSSDTVKLVAVYDPTANLLDPNSPIWSTERKSESSGEVDANGKPTGTVSTTIVPLSSQYILPPQGGSILGLTARAAWTGKDFAVRVSWKDDTQNITGPSVDYKNSFSDAVAVEFPIELIPGRAPFRCMGQSENKVNIWQWKAERDRGLNPNPVLGNPEDKAVKNYIGPGAGYLIDPSQDDPESKAFYNDQEKTWTVIFKRPLVQGSKETSVQFPQPKAGNIASTQIAFAVWDGSKGERLSKKAVSTWVDLTFEPGNTAAQTTEGLVNLGIVGVLTLVVLGGAWKLLPNTRRPSRDR